MDWLVGVGADQRLEFAEYSGLAVKGHAEVWRPARGRLTVHPNPVRLGATFAVGAWTRPVLVEIYDPKGRLIDLLKPGERGNVRWTAGRASPPGMYFARVRGGGRS